MEPTNGGSPMQSMQPNTDKSIGPAIGIIVIIAVIVLGGLYFWGQRIEQRKAVTPVVQESSVTSQNQDAMMRTNGSVGATQTQNTADDTVSIESELNATNVNSIDPGVDEINGAAATQ